MSSKDLPNCKDTKAEWLRDPEFKAAYDALEPEYALAKQFIDLRIKHKLTQAELAVRLDMKQSAIARLESGRANPSYKTLYKILTALGESIKVGR